MKPRLLILITALLVSACSGVVRNPMPGDVFQQATVLGRDDLRFWANENFSPTWLTQSPEQAEEVRRNHPAIANTEHNYLAISGGGANGAYGAGLLVGWSALGTRPVFTMVTGISTGALTAPFAFLGERYDEQLQEVYTTLDTSSILELGNVFNVFRADAITDVTPLKNTIKKYVTDDMIAEIAAVHRRGRTLLIGTTNLDAGAAIYWNIGRIANTGDPDAAALIRDILLASASIPGVFPPVYIKAQTPDGRTYDEMHVDGGTSAQMFLYPPSMDWESMTRVLKVKGTPSAYLIRNSYLRSDYDPVKPRLGPILGRTIDSLIRTQGVGDAYRIHALAERDGVDVRLTWIPDSAVDVQAEEAFDPNYMKALFDFGYERAVSGKPWLDVSDALYSGSTENLRFEGMTP